ncbi:hypothetical protein AVEN_150489-1 [Araneus ventricosus]|uniref:Uncharacterized protein n=1 Tax=Araneus ventricosus TaxID=182803 RepID=A0A4Y2H4X2_ARAVE|nr:hypothetical protein AVEN_150489-1 [Araneus ventricosus]
MVTSRLRCRWIPGSTPDSVEDMWMFLPIKSDFVGQTSFLCCDAEVWRGRSSSGVIAICQCSKLRGPPQNSHRVASKWDHIMNKLSSNGLSS